jgi:DNA repair protein RadC
MEFEIQALPREERPRERLLRAGASTLSDREILAVLLGRGIAGLSVLRLAGRILDEVGGLRALATRGARHLERIPGVGPGQAARVLAGLELGRRFLAATARPRVLVRGPGDLQQHLLAELGGLTQEVFGVFLLDARMRLIRFERVGEGTLTAAPASARALFSRVLASPAAALILAHNHPSGDPTPSEADLAVTAQMVAIGRSLELPVLDHIILGGTRVVSLRDSGRMFPEHGT